MVVPDPDGWFVDDRCMNCDAARQLAPELIGEVDGRSAMLRQPRDEAELAAVRAAAYACPTRSIRHPGERPDGGHDPFPVSLDEHVQLCGHHSTHTAGAAAYLLRRRSGLIMIDTPRWSESLAARYQELGPVTDVLLTHRDHAAHGQCYAERFGARLWIHQGDLDAAPGADRVLRGTEPVEVADGVVAHPLPGHTEGSVLYLADDQYCFTGDSIYWSRTTADLEVADNVTWYSIAVLGESLVRTVPRLRFEWLLPGHGSRVRLPADEMSRRLAALTVRVQALEPRPVDFTAARW